jgi:hypothetical protein
MVRSLPGHWISNQEPDVLTYDTLPTLPDGALRNVVALDGVPLAWTRSRDQAIIWFGTAGTLARTDAGTLMARDLLGATMMVRVRLRAAGALATVSRQLLLVRSLRKRSWIPSWRCRQAPRYSQPRRLAARQP